MRTSRIAEHAEVLRVMKNTHAAAYTGIHMFTAGVLLSVVALSQPLSSEAQEAKKAISRVIRLSKALGHRTVLSAQGGNILQSLVRVILTKEMKELLAEQTPETQDEGILTMACPTPCPGSHSQGTPSFSAQDVSTFPLEQALASSQGGYESHEQQPSQLQGGKVLSGAIWNTDLSEGFMSVQRGKYARCLVSTADLTCCSDPRQQ